MKVVNQAMSSAGQSLQSNSSNTATDEAAKQRLREWTLQLKSVSLQIPADVQKLLKEVSHGLASPDDAAKAQAVFNDLIAHEAVGVFVEVFNAYNAIRAGQMLGRDEPPFKSLLILELPSDWSPVWPAALHAALERVKVERLEVVHSAVYVPSAMAIASERLTSFAAGIRSLVQGPAPYRYDEPYLREVEDRLRRAEEKQEKEKQKEKIEGPHIANVPVPAAVCECIQTLLKNGTTELAVRGRLKSPELVAEAIAQSTHLRLVELGEPDPWELDLETDHLTYKARKLARENTKPRAFTPEKMKSYEALMAGLARCKTFEHLVIRQKELIQLHPWLAKFDPEHSQLKSVKVMREWDRLVITKDSQPHALAFMQAVAAFKKLKEVSLFVDYLSPRDLNVVVLKPLRKHPSLVKLEILNELGDYENPQGMCVMPWIGTFADGCPTLTHLRVETGRLYGWGASEMASYLRRNPKFDATVTAKIPDNPTGNLQELTVIGVPLSPRYTAAFFGRLRGNMSLQYLNLSGNIIGIGAVLMLPEILANNRTLRHCQLPEDPANYFLMSDDGGIHGVSKHNKLDVEEHAENDPAALKSAQEAFEKLRGLVATAPTAAQSMLDRRSREEAAQYLQMAVSSLMSQAAGPHHAHTFDDPAGVVMEYLGDARSLREVVHLSEQNKTVDHHKLHLGNPTPAPVKALVRTANAQAASKGLDTAPLAVNRVNARGANRALRTAARNDDPVDVRNQKKAGAINFHGLVDRDARSPAVLAALREPVPAATASAASTNTPSTTAPDMAKAAPKKE
ncbi:hypothetical protein [Hydrogenophaga sp.]|uniref:hypothetical protein n=1 Tax=Hydrogenophaga sp. TaxID=1904254 RepID=UPI002721E3BE|nr:hypothetical protein [Hydrogenophaga sp.]MDO9434710.1 hypothetical protein [Hydrogenophaga sp.]